MKTADAGLIAFVNSGQAFYCADCYTFTLRDGSVFRFTTFDTDLTVGGNVFLATSLKFARTRIRTVIGMEVDQMQMRVFAGPADALTSIPFLQACASGQLDKATIKLQRAVMQTAGNTSLGAVTHFLGTVSDIKAGRTQAQISVKSSVELLNVALPRALYQPACRHTLFDAGCTLSAAAFQVNSAAASGSTKSQINCGLAQAAGHFDQGKVVFTSGVNTGLTRSVKSYTPGVLMLMPPLPATPGVGDGFTATPGCDKLQSTCTAKFNNVLNFGGAPYVPPPENAI